MLTLNGHYFFCINLDLHEHTNTHIEKELKQKRFTEKKKSRKLSKAIYSN